MAKNHPPNDSNQLATFTSEFYKTNKKLPALIYVRLIVVDNVVYMSLDNYSTTEENEYCKTCFVSIHTSSDSVMRLESLEFFPNATSYETLTYEKFRPSNTFVHMRWKLDTGTSIVPVVGELRRDGHFIISECGSESNTRWVNEYTLQNHDKLYFIKYKC